MKSPKDSLVGDETHERTLSTELSKYYDHNNKKVVYNYDEVFLPNYVYLKGLQNNRYFRVILDEMPRISMTAMLNSYHVYYRNIFYLNAS